ncbi:MAG: heme/hemin ABC transporter substrate-binding protein [Aureispira sp.]
MNHSKYIILSLLLLLMMESCQDGKAPEQERIVTETKAIVTEQRIISLNGTVTELLYAVNYGDKIVGVDVTSTYPEAAQSKTNLGHTRQLNTEAILALKPSLILVDEKGSQSSAIATLENSGIQIGIVKIPETLEGSLEAAGQLEKLLDVTFDTKALEEKITTNKQALAQLLEEKTTRPKVLFIYARGAQTMMVAGTNTFAEKMIKVAGGELAIEEIDGFQPLTPEALLQSNPEVILMFNSGLESMAEEGAEKTALEQLLATPGIAQTPAGKNKKVITMEGLYLSGFGPRASAAALELAQALHP